MNKQIKNNNNLWLRCDGNISRGKHLFGDGGNSANYANIASTIGSYASKTIDSFSDGINIDTSNIENAINTFTDTPIESSSREALINQWVNTVNPKNNWTGDDLRRSDGQRIGDFVGSVGSAAGMGAQIAGGWGALGFAVGETARKIGEYVWENHNARKKANKLNKQANQAILNRRVNNSAVADYLDEQDSLNFLRQSFANGGYLGQTQKEYNLGEIYDIDEQTAEELIKLGYEFDRI